MAIKAEPKADRPGDRYPPMGGGGRMSDYGPDRRAAMMPPAPSGARSEHSLFMFNGRVSNSRRLLLRSYFFLQFKEFDLHWGAVFFTTRKGVSEKSFFKINFVGVNFEAGNETREKIWSDFVAEQNEVEQKGSGFFVYFAVF